MKKVFIFLVLFGFYTLVYADTLYLLNGRSIEGLIKSEDQDSIELEVGAGIVKFKKSEIGRIDKSSLEESELLRQKWERQKIETEKKILKQQLEEERKPKKVEFLQDSQSIILRVRLNKKVEASLVLDTGASLVVLRRKIAEKLGINLDGIKPDAKMTLADGRQINAKHIILESVEVEGVEARNVEATIMLDDSGNLNFGDGLLGMSFLKRFNFKVDHKDKKLILEKL